MTHDLYVTTIGLVGETGMQNPVMQDDYLLSCVSSGDNLHKEYVSRETKE